MAGTPDSAMEVPFAHGIALAWLRCGSPGRSRIGAAQTRVTVLKAVNFPGTPGYFRRAANPGSAMDMGSTSGTRFASLSASSYST